MEKEEKFSHSLVIQRTAPACHGTCFHRRLSTHHAGATPCSAVAELEVVRRNCTPAVKTTISLSLLCVLTMAACVTTKTLDTSDSDVRQHIDLEGRSLTFAFEQLGTATISDRTTPASELGGEFYTPVNRRFPPDSPRSRSILIREVRWQRGDYYISALCTRQLGQWRVFDSVKWRKDIVF
jgi:hypothetical protein